MNAVENPPKTDEIPPTETLLSHPNSPPSSSKPDRSKRTVALVVACIIIALLAVGLAIIVSLYIKNAKKCKINSEPVGLCLNNETFNLEPILLITFGNGSVQYSTATPADFHFSTTYQQKLKPFTGDGSFSFVNSVHNENPLWHTNARDHSGDNGGYMYLVNVNFIPGQFYNGRFDNLCAGLRYKFFVYLANICKPAGRIKPNVLFEVRSVDGNVLLAQLNTGDIAEHDNLIWKKYGFSFIAPNSSVNLLMISNVPGGNGNDIVIDDIALHVCAHKGTGFCPSK